MEIPGLTLGPTTTGLTTTPTLSLIRGDLTRLPVGDLISASLITPLQGNQAQVRASGSELTLRLPFPVSPDSAILLRAVPPIVPNGKPTLQFLGEVFTAPKSPAIPVDSASAGQPTATKSPIPSNPSATPSVTTPSSSTTPGTLPGNVLVPGGTPGPNGTPARTPEKAKEQASSRPIPSNFIPATVRQDSSGKLQLEIGKNLIPIQAEQLQPGQQVLIRLPGPGPRTPFSRSASPSIEDGEPLPEPSVSPSPSESSTTGTTRPRPVIVDSGVVTRLLDLSQGIPSRAPGPTQPALVVAEGVGQPTPDGRQTVRIAGREVTLTTAEPIPVGARSIVRIEITPEGVTFRPVQPSEVPPGKIAEAVLNAFPSRPEVGPTIQTLLKNLADVPARAATPEVAQLKTLLSELLPTRSDPPNAAQLERFVREGGLQYETRLAKLPENAAGEQVREVAAKDLKGQILRLLSASAGKAAPEATHPLPAAKQALEAIEVQQTINSLAGTNGGTFQINLPLTGPAQWLTLQLAVQPDMAAGDGEGTNGQRGSRGFNLLMHVDLTDLGDTWIDARVSGKNLSAVLYLESSSGRELARSQSPELKSALREAGFESILVDVRSTAELPEGRGGAPFESLRRTEPINPSIVDERA